MTRLSVKWEPFYLSLNVLTHSGPVTPYGDKDLGQQWLRSWLVACWHQAITLTSVDFSSIRFCGIHMIAIFTGNIGDIIH